MATRITIFALVFIAGMVAATYAYRVNVTDVMYDRVTSPVYISTVVQDAVQARLTRLSTVK